MLGLSRRRSPPPRHRALQGSNRLPARIRTNRGKPMAWALPARALSRNGNPLVTKNQGVDCCYRRIGRTPCQRKYFSSTHILMLACPSRDCLSGLRFRGPAQRFASISPVDTLVHARAWRLPRGLSRSSGALRSFGPFGGDAPPPPGRIRRC